MIIAARAAHGQTARRGAILVLYAFAINPGVIGVAAGNFSAAGEPIRRWHFCVAVRNMRTGLLRRGAGAEVAEKLAIRKYFLVCCEWVSSISNNGLAIRSDKKSGRELAMADF
jgi:hypothetical protein